MSTVKGKEGGEAGTTVNAHPAALLSLIKRAQYYPDNTDIYNLAAQLTNSTVYRKGEFKDVHSQMLSIRYPQLSKEDIPELSGVKAHQWIINRLSDDEFKRIQTIGKENGLVEHNKALEEAGLRIFSADLLKKYGTISLDPFNATAASPSSASRVT